MLIISFVRHGESLDNIKSVWAGHKDSELSELGVRQAAALGESYANTHLDAIITSDLKRAHATATALLNHQPNPKPTFTVDSAIREQNFGDAEGHQWIMPTKSLQEHIREGQYPIVFDHNERFPNGESLNDVAARAERAINDLVLKPYLPRALSAAKDVHVAVVSHGLCISQLIPSLLMMNHGGASIKDYRGLLNTAWTRVTIQTKAGIQVTEVNNTLDNLPPLIVTVTNVNRHEHIDNVKRQKGIVEYDPKQRGIREFFGGGGVKKATEVLEHAESDTVDVDKVELEERN